MKNTTLVSIMSFVFLTISSIVAYFLRFYQITEPITFVIGGIGILLVSGIISIFVKKNIVLNLMCFTLSAVALGFVIRAWYILRGFDNSILTMMLVSLACVVYLWIFFFLISIPFIEKHKISFFWIFLILSIIGYTLVVIYTKTTFVSTFGYYMFVEAAFTFALLMYEESNDISQIIRAITISTYSVLVVAVIVLIFCLSDGDLDIDIGGGSKESSTSKHTSTRTKPKLADVDYYTVAEVLDPVSFPTEDEYEKKKKEKNKDNTTPLKKI